MMKEGMLTATPNFNLISNIGFGQDSTHTKDLKSPLSNLNLSSINKQTSILAGFGVGINTIILKLECTE